MTEEVKAKANSLLDSIRNSAKEKELEDEVVLDEVPEEPEMPKWEPKAGEVLFEPSVEGDLLTTAFPDGREVGFPFIASNAKDIAFLNSFATHCGRLKVTEG